MRAKLIGGFPYTFALSHGSTWQEYAPPQACLLQPLCPLSVDQHFLLPRGDGASLGFQGLHLGASTQSLTEASVGALGWQIHATFFRIYLGHSLNLLAPNSARKGRAISWAPSNPMTSHLFMHLTFLSRPHARWGQAGTSSTWFVRQGLASVSYRHQINVHWTECEERCDSSPHLRCAKQHVRSFHDLMLPASQPLGR